VNVVQLLLLMLTAEFYSRINRCSAFK